jgi:N utilization substance protein B
MANRHVCRSIVLQILFERDAASPVLAVERCLDRIDDYSGEFGAKEGDVSYMQELVKTAIAKQKEIDDVIVKAAPEWPINRIAAIDRAILRLGLAELLYADRAQVPAKVALNEAIELAKEFGGPSSSKFVNGVLGAVYLELGEPGKAEGGKRKEKQDPLTMPMEECAGAVVYSQQEGETYLAFVHDIFGHWTLSKGRIEAGEDPKQGAIREIKEEMGLDIEIELELGVNEYVANDKEVKGGKKRKRVTYFLAHSPFSELRLGPSGGLDDAQWFPLASVGSLNFYDDTLKIIIPAIKALGKK